jgi:hypothetical protein
MQTLHAFLDAGLRHDEEAMKKCVTRQSLESGQVDVSATPDGMEFVTDNDHMEGETAVIGVRAFPAGTPHDATPAMEMPCLLVREDGQWKIDLVATIDRMMGGSFEAMAGQMATAMGEAMEGVGKALADGFSQAFGENSPAALEGGPGQMWADASLRPDMDELQPVNEMMTLPKTQAAFSLAVGSDQAVEAAIDAFLVQLNSDERDVLVTWLEDTLLPGWPAMLERVGQAVPLTGRLRGVRFEAASGPDERLLAVDGSDLVYRMYVARQDGYYSDDEVAAALPGVLAGLPAEIEPYSRAGWRLLPTDKESPSLDLYRQHVAPRFMRRLSELVGHDVALEIDWAAAANSTLAPHQLWLWGLNRVYGAAALVCLVPPEREKVAKDLKTVRITLGPDVTGRIAGYEGGRLEIALCYYGGPQGGGFYEHEIAEVLAGEPM